MNSPQIHALLDSLPADLRREAADFIEFLKQKSNQREKAKKRQAGMAKGLVKMNPDFDEPLDDFLPYME
ncbi:MAG: DUF2281 domain-containing protein [Flavobacteriales bacterium]|nr:DUF2281 domain-containing protein [Flavobacteriales bacterium]